MEAIYERPEDYELEHEGDDEDVGFYVGLLHDWQPCRVMELASGSGRVTLPLARAAAVVGSHVVGLEREGPMLDEAVRRLETLSPQERTCVCFQPGDMRDWRTPEPFDLVIAPCASLSHLLTLDDQIAAWRCAYENLTDGGRFVVDLAMPNLVAYADSMLTPPRAVVEIDVDARDPLNGTACCDTRPRAINRIVSEPRSDFYTTSSRRALTRIATSVTSTVTSTIPVNWNCCSGSLALRSRRGLVITRCSGFAHRAGT
jgi:SAM-dependent methyltransferase